MDTFIIIIICTVIELNVFFIIECGHVVKKIHIILNQDFLILLNKKNICHSYAEKKVFT